jgi:hypothetical protein
MVNLVVLFKSEIGFFSLTNLLRKVPSSILNNKRLLRTGALLIGSYTTVMATFTHQLSIIDLGF